MKRIFCIVLSVLLLVILAVPVTAHSGMTDAAGGHYDSSTGEYHYHHGYPAHSHDNGCPYNYKDKTDYSSSGSTSSSSSGCNDAGSIISVLFGIFCLGSVFAFIVFICVEGSKSKKHSTSSLDLSIHNPPQNNELNKSLLEKKEQHQQYVSACPSTKPITSFCINQPYRLYFTYQPENIEGDDLSDFDKERIALILSIIEPGVSKYLGFSKTVFVDYDFYPLEKSHDSFYDRSVQHKFLSLNNDLKKYNLSLWVNRNKPVLSISVSYVLSLPQQYCDKILPYMVMECGLRIDFG